MKPYSVDFREKIVQAYQQGNSSIRTVAQRFGVSKAFVQKMLQQNRSTGDLTPGKQGGGPKAQLAGCHDQLVAMVEQQPDATLAEYCDYWAATHDQVLSPSTLCRALQKANLSRKKTLRSTQAASERVQRQRCEYWEAVKQIEPEQLVFLDEMGVLLGLSRTHARSLRGQRAYDSKPFYRGAKVSVIGAISLKRVLGVMSLEGSMDGDAFAVFVEQCLVPELWVGAVVVMDNLPAHKGERIKRMIESVGARVLELSPYSPEFNPIELWWSQLKAFLRQFSPRTTKMVDRWLSVALELVMPEHLRNWFANCCYCTS